MSVQRINPPSLAQPPTYSHAVRAEGKTSIFTAGAVPLDRDGVLVGAGDPGRQAAKTLDNLTVTLEEAGATLEDVVKITTYVASSDRSMLETVWRAIEQSVIATAASTMIGVETLYYADQLVEIEAVAIV